MRELVSRTGMSQTAFAKQAGIPLRTVQDWCCEKRACPAYVRFLLAGIIICYNLNYDCGVYGIDARAMLSDAVLAVHIAA